MKKIALITICLISLAFSVTNTLYANSSYSASYLYLKVFNGQQFKVVINDTDTFMSKDGVIAIDGLIPGRYTIKVIQASSAVIGATSVSSQPQEVLIYSGQIQVIAKKIMYAVIDQNQEFHVIKMKNTVTVSNTDATKAADLAINWNQMVSWQENQTVFTEE
ncbi:MAG: hypothetical protein ACPGXL_07630 [Chitinophagales bacterium]